LTPVEARTGASLRQIIKDAFLQYCILAHDFGSHATMRYDAHQRKEHERDVPRHHPPGHCE
jgi:hypothetical protein